MWLYVYSFWFVQVLLIRVAVIFVHKCGWKISVESAIFECQHHMALTLHISPWELLTKPSLLVIGISSFKLLVIPRSWIKGKAISKIKTWSHSVYHLKKKTTLSLHRLQNIIMSKLLNIHIPRLQHSSHNFIFPSLFCTMYSFSSLWQQTTHSFLKYDSHSQTSMAFSRQCVSVISWTTHLCCYLPAEFMT